MDIARWSANTICGELCPKTKKAPRIDVVGPDGVEQHKINDGKPGLFATDLYNKILGIQYGGIEDKRGWNVVVPNTPLIK